MHQLAALAIDWGFSQDVADRAFAELLQSGPVPEQVTQALGDRFLELCMSIAHQVLPAGEEPEDGAGVGGTMLLNLDDLGEQDGEGGDDGSDLMQEGEEEEGEEEEGEDGDEEAGTDGSDDGEDEDEDSHRDGFHNGNNMQAHPPRGPHASSHGAGTLSKGHRRHVIQDDDSDDQIQVTRVVNMKQGTLDRHFTQQPQQQVGLRQPQHQRPAHAHPQHAFQASNAPAWQQPPTAQECQTVRLNDPASMLDFVNLRVFGNKSFRESQKDVVQAAVSGQHCFVLMPTGGGKSLCYQLPAVIARGVTIVVCPLLSLMQDQVSALCQGRPGGCGIPATFLSSQQSKAEALGVLRELNKDTPTCKLLYITPEQLVKSNVLREVLARLKARGRLARFVIDEAHCVSMWGHDFRVDYKLLGNVLKAKFPDVPVTAVTATATETVAGDILTTLGIASTAQRFKVSFFRPNLVFSVVDKVYGTDEDGNPEPLTSLIEYINTHNERALMEQAGGAGHQGRGKPPVLPSGIVYCLSRDESEQVARALEEVGGIKSAHYHAGMTPKARMKVQNDWRSGMVQVVVATIAFGMGIDKPDVRFVVHYTLSKSLEGYFQEAGRAGRDGLPSECVIFYGKRDNSRIMNMLRMGKGNYQQGVELLSHMRDYCENLDRCRHDQLLEYFADSTRLQRLAGGCGGKCDNCRERSQPGTGGREAARQAARGGPKKRGRKQRADEDEEDGGGYDNGGHGEEGGWNDGWGEEQRGKRSGGKEGSGRGSGDAAPGANTISKLGGFMSATAALASGALPDDKGKGGKGKGAKAAKTGSGKAAGSKAGAAKSGKAAAAKSSAGGSTGTQSTLLGFKAFSGQANKLSGGSVPASNATGLGGVGAAPLGGGNARGAGVASGSGTAAVFNSAGGTGASDFQAGFRSATGSAGFKPAGAGSASAGGGPNAGAAAAGGIVPVIKPRVATNATRPPATAQPTASASAPFRPPARPASSLPVSGGPTSRAAQLQAVGAAKATKERQKAVAELAQVQGKKLPQSSYNDEVLSE